MRFVVVLVVLLASFSFSPVGVASGSATQHYDVGTTPVVVVHCPACTMGLVTVGVVKFLPQGGVPLVVRVDDDLGEPLQQGCGGTLSLVNFRSYAAVEVYVEVVAAICGPATSGDVTVGYL